MAAPDPLSLDSSLAASRTSLIGREGERATARTLPFDDTVPRLTLACPGGLGKMGLALALAQNVAQTADDVVRVDVTPITDPAEPLAIPRSTTRIGRTTPLGGGPTVTGSLR